MRSFGSRGDTVVVDEPLYARYLHARPELRHPGRDEIVAAGPIGLARIIASLTGPLPGGKVISYQKHMAQHLLPGDFEDLGWIDALCNCFLIRDPGEMIASFIRIVPDPTPEDLGLPQQVRLFEIVRDRTGRTPPVLDSRDVLEDPRGMLSALCERVGTGFDEAMLSWEPGPRVTDGVWGRHWYDSVYESTGFARYHTKDEAVPERLAGVDAKCQTLYDTLFQFRLRG